MYVHQTYEAIRAIEISQESKLRDDPEDIYSSLDMNQLAVDDKGNPIDLIQLNSQLKQVNINSQ